MNIVDAAGVWVINRGQFPFHDPISGVTYQPGELTCAPATQWLAEQAKSGVFEPRENPFDASKKQVAKVKAITT